MPDDMKKTKAQLIEELDQLRDREQGMRALLDASLDPMGLFDFDGTILELNERGAASLHRTPSELIGKNLFELLPPSVSAARHQMFEKAVRTGQTVKHQERRGESILDISITPLTDSGLTAIVIHDVTGTVEALDARRKSENQYRRMVETANEAILALDVDQTVTYANQIAADFLACPIAELMGSKLYELLHPDELEAQQKRMEQRKKGERGRYEVRFLRKDGQTMWGLVSATPILSDEGIFVGSFAMITDITTRKRFEEELARSEHHFRAIFENAVEGLYQSTPDGEFLHVNPAMARIMGYDSPEEILYSITDIATQLYVDPEERQPLVDMLRREGEMYDRETRVRRKDGTIIWVSENARAIKNEHGEIIRLEGSMVDVTERKQTEEELRRNRELLNQVQRISRTGGWEVDMLTRETAWTDGQFELLGLKPGDVEPDPNLFFEKFVHPDDQQRLTDGWLRIMNERETVELEYRIVRADGGTTTCIGVVVPEVDETGWVRRVYGSNRDVTEERGAEVELAHAHKRLLTILDGMEADIYVSELESGELLFMNAHMRQTFGEPGPGEFCHDIFRGEPALCTDCPKPYLLDSKGNPTDTIITERHNPRTDRWYLNHDRAIEWIEGRLAHMHMATDITNLKLMEQELKLAMTRAEAASVAKSQFLANMSHEIRTPLNGLLGMLQLLQLTTLVPEQQDFLDTAYESGRNLLQVLNDILDLSKIESGKLELSSHRMALDIVLDEVVAVFSHQAQQRGVNVSWKTDDTLPNTFLMDTGRLRQILFNLIGNAAKFTSKGSVSVEAYPMPHRFDDGHIQLLFMVKDTGIGIPEDMLRAVFDPFTQVDGSFTRRYQGTGLGLSIVQRLVALMGGTISVSSVPDQGTTIAFTVKAYPVDADIPVQAVTAFPTPFKPLRILLAEDEHVNRIVAKRLLTELGHEVVTAENGIACLELLGKSQYDAILMDIQMPGLDGIEATRIIRQEKKLTTPIIALTAHAMKGDRSRFLDAGMDGYVAKPFELTEIDAELRRVVGEAEQA